MRGHGFPSQGKLRSLIRSASMHDGPWPTISIWHGMADRTVDPSNMVEISVQWRGVHQVAEMPTRSDVIDGFPHRVWCDPDGRILIEENSVAGMGHGTPIATTGPNSYGVAGPFMLDVGISSTFHIARSWDLTDAAESVENNMFPHTYSSHSAAVDRVREPEADPVSSSHSGASERRPPLAQMATGVKKVIEDALRAAGSMR